MSARQSDPVGMAHTLDFTCNPVSCQTRVVAHAHMRAAMADEY